MSYESSLRRSSESELQLKKILEKFNIDESQNIADLIITEDELVSELNKVMIIGKIAKELNKIKKLFSKDLMQKMDEFGILSIDGIKVITTRDYEKIDTKKVKDYFNEHHLDIRQVMSSRKGFSYLLEVKDERRVLK